MTANHPDKPQLLDSVAAELKADKQCTDVLREFHNHLLEHGHEPLEAGELARGADYFLRDFVISACNRSIFTPQMDCVKQFAGHWYIVNNLEPSIEELQPILQGIAAFYEFLQVSDRIAVNIAQNIQRDCTLIDLFSRRLEEFWAIENDGYLKWRAECPLPGQNR